MAMSGGEQVWSRAHPMVPSARPEVERGRLATCACGSAAHRLTAAALWGTTATSGFRRGVRELRREVREVVVQSIWVEGGWRRRNNGGQISSSRRQPWRPRSGARAAPESEGRRVGRLVSARAARAFAFGGAGAGQRVARRRDARRQWSARSAAWLPRRQNNEHVACVFVPDLGSVFGPSLLRIGLWALKQNYSPSDALQT